MYMYSLTTLVLHEILYCIASFQLTNIVVLPELLLVSANFTFGLPFLGGQFYLTLYHFAIADTAM